MTVTYLIDTNTFSYIASGYSAAARATFRRLSQDSNAELCISVITEAEVRYGFAWKKLSPARQKAIENLLSQFIILPWDSAAAAVYGRARAKLRPKGLSVETMDLLIAAHATSSKAILVTHDAIFSKIAADANIPTIEDWANDL